MYVFLTYIFPIKAIAVKTNVADLNDINVMIDTAVKVYGTLDILVNNAGIMDSMAAVGDVNDEKWDLIFDINTKGIMRVIRKAIPIFLDKGKGVIINTASTITNPSPNKNGSSHYIIFVEYILKS